MPSSAQQATDLLDRILEAKDLVTATAAIRKAPPKGRHAAVEPLARQILDLLRSDARLALARSDRLSALAESTKDPLHKARAAWVRGHALGELLRHEEALESYHHAESIYRENGHGLEAARVCLGQVNVLRHLGADERALRLGEQARVQLLRHGDRLAAIRMDTNLASIHHRHERHTAALRVYTRALRLARRAGDGSMERIVQYNRAGVLARLGRLGEARDLYSNLRADIDPAREQRLLGSIEHSLGSLALSSGDYDGAFRHLDDARSVFEELDDPHYLLQTLLELAALLLEMSSFARAQAMADQAIERARAHAMRPEEARGTLLLGMAELGGGSPEKAAESLRRARELLRKVGQPVSAALGALYQAEAATRRQHRGRAAALLRRAIEVFHAHHVRLLEVTAHLRLGMVELERRDLTRARTALDTARRILRKAESRWLRAQASHLAGRLAEAEDKIPQALRHYRRALEELESIRGRIGLDEFRVSFSDDRAPLYTDAIHLLLRRGQPRDDDEAFGWIERSRSRTMTDVLAAPLTSHEQEHGDRARSLTARIERLRSEVNTLVGFGPDRPDVGRPNLDWSRVRPLVRRKEAELADLYQRLTRYDTRWGVLAKRERPSLVDLRDRLPENVTLVEYFTAEPVSHAFVVRRDGARVVKLPAGRREISERLQHVRFQLEKWTFGPDYVRARAKLLRGTLDHRLQSLAESIWDPLEIQDEAVWLVSHGPLHGVPFYALPVSGGPRVLDRHLVVQLPAASVLLDAPSSTSPRAAVGRSLVVGIADEALPFLDSEIRRVRTALGRSQVLRNRAATRERFAAASEEAEIIHLATHGMFRGDDPYFSALLLGDGWMTLYDVYRLRLQARLVTLSACQSGRMRFGGGDELMGLARGFLHAGTQALLVSLWSVDDRSTAELMATFYRELASRKPAEENPRARPADALRQAMLAVRASYPDPYHWAPFELISANPAG